ncbi:MULTISPECIES: DUF1016 domain-containing protein [Halomonas]|uniref:DUF1016 domain-containing protein n=1 Tax=Halomonas TaxID=2745 RepID=UPI0011428E2B
MGKGFNVTNLCNMQQFYQRFSIRETVSLELRWSHRYQKVFEASLTPLTLKSRLNY